jgi:hypothetical protein
MSGRKWLVANLTIEQSIYNFWPRTHSHRLVERLAVRAFKLIVEHSTSSGCASYVHAEALQDAFDFRSTARWHGGQGKRPQPVWGLPGQGL